MHSVYDYVVEPLGERYNNSKKVGGKELILNTEIFNHQHVNREARVLSVPSAGATLNPKVGDVVTLHHNVFRRWHDVKGRERNSRSFLEEGKYLVSPDQIFLYKRDKDWICPNGYCFVKPLRSISKFDLEEERPLVGIVKYTDGTVNEGDLVGFRPSSQFEFVVDGQRMYRVLSNFITIKYEYQGDEEEYNPSWAGSS
jgi:hypothetical protein